MFAIAVGTRLQHVTAIGKNPLEWTKPKKKTQNKVDREWERGGDNKKREIPMEYAVKREAKIRTENRRGRSLLVCLSLWAMRHPAIQESYRHLCICPPRRKEESKQIFREFDGFGQGFVQDFLRSLTTSLQDSWKILQRFPANFLNQTGDLYWIDSYIYLCWKMNFSFFIKEWTTLLHFSSFAIIIVLFSLLLFLFFCSIFVLLFDFFFVFQIFNFCVDPLLL